MQRPVVVKGDRAVLARPVERGLELLERRHHLVREQAHVPLRFVVRHARVAEDADEGVVADALAGAERWIAERRAGWEDQLDHLGDVLEELADDSAPDGPA